MSSSQAVAPLFPLLRAGCESPALRVGSVTLSYGELHARCLAVAESLRGAGLGPGSHVGIWTYPDLDAVVALVAAVTAGTVAVPLNPDLGDRELAHILGDAQPDVILSARDAGDRGRGLAVPVLPILEPRRADAGRGSDLAEPRGQAPSDAACTPAGVRELTNARLREDAPALVLYTSGTTGAPKGAVLSARNIASTLDGLAHAWALGGRDTLVHGLPLFHAHGLVFGLFGALRAGACLHWLPRFSPEAVAEALKASPTTVLYAVPTMYHRLLDAAERDASVAAGLVAARLLVSGSAALPEREYRRLESLTGRGPCERYGLTETLINTAVRLDAPRTAGWVGTPLPGVELRLVDDARRPVVTEDADAMGEVAVRGPHVFLGYLRNPAATEQVRDAEGWFYTGDVGTLGRDGALRILGRKSTDIIKTGGFKVGAGEIEAALLEHRAISEAAVLGVADPDLGERIEAFVVVREGAQAPEAQELIDLVAARLARHKRPRAVHFLDGLPRNAMGKVRKSALR